MTFIRLLGIAAVAGLLTACEKSGSNAANANKSTGAGSDAKAGASQPVPVTTKSGVK